MAFRINHTLLAMLAGGLITGGIMGPLGYLKIQALTQENQRLEAKVKKLNWNLENISQSQTSLIEELEGIKQAKAEGYEQTINSLLVAKENADLDALYQLGLKALAEKDYPRAFYALDKVNTIQPQYKDLKKHYPEAKIAFEKYENTRFEEDLKHAYAQALDHQAKQQLAQAKESYQKVLALKADYKDAKNRLATVTRHLETITKTRELAQEKKWLQDTYALGVSHQTQGRYRQAQAAYEQVLSRAPKYKDVAKRLKITQIEVAKLPPLPKPPPQQPQAPPLDCYQVGVEFAQCAAGGLDSSKCQNRQSLTSVPPECKQNPEFQRGLNALLSTGYKNLLKAFE